MSRIGKLPVNIPDGVQVNLNETEITVKGPKGELTKKFSPTINLEIKDNEVVTAVWDSVNECFYESKTKKEVDSRDIAEWWKDI